MHVMSWGGSEKNRWFQNSTRRFDQYALIVFWRKLRVRMISPPIISGHVTMVAQSVYYFILNFHRFVFYPEFSIFICLFKKYF